jgi:UDP-N-acetylglucosamine transferase subunit ALG13
MILVLLGTFTIEFKRPLVEIEKLCAEGKLTEEIIVQNGHTKFSSPHFKMFPFIQPDLLDQLYDKARIIITHAGTGSIIKGLKKGKKIIAIARLEKKGEHIDDHQLEILNEFARSGYILPWHESDDLEQVLQKVNNFTPKVYNSQKEKILNFLQNYIDSL